MKIAYFIATSIFIFVADCKASPAHHPIKIHHQKPSHHPLVALSSGQLNGGFRSVAYAASYDGFGKGLMQGSPYIIETAASSRDAENGFYIMMRQKRLPPDVAQHLAQICYDSFVKLRGHFFSPDEARHCEVTVRTKDDNIMAYADQSGASPDKSFYDMQQ